MSFFDIAPGQEAAQANRASLHPATPEDMAASAFGGIPTAFGGGLFSAAAKIGQLAGDAAIPAGMTADKFFGTDTETWLRAEAAKTDAQVQKLRPNPYVVGGVGRALHGLAEVGSLFAAGFAAGGPPGAAALAGTVEGYSGVKTGLAEGLDPRTALLKGTVEGVATAAGAYLPVSVAGAPLWQSAAFGAGVNLVFGAENRGLTSDLLRRAGYPDQAAQYQTLDKSGMAADLILGLAFGTWAHVAQPKQMSGAVPEVKPMDAPAPSTVDAAMVVKSELHNRDVAGVAADIETANTVNDAIARETMALLSGEPRVDVVEHPEAKFVEDPNGSVAQVQKATAELIAEEPAPAPIAAPVERVRYTPSEKDLTPEERAVEQAFGARPLAELEAAYAKIPETEGGKVLSTDVARELDPAYLKNRSERSRAVHEPASGFIKQLYAKRLAEPPAEGQEAAVLFTAGGTGAGKTTGLEAPGMGAVKDAAQIVYDTNMNKYESAKAKVDQALEAGKEAIIVHVYREPVDALRGAMRRAMRQEGEFGSGRTVPLAEHLDTHVGSREVMLQLEREYADRAGSVHFRFVDNSRGVGKQTLVNVDFLAGKEHNRTVLRDQLRQALEDAKAKGQISDAVYRGFAQGEPALPAAEPGLQARGQGRGGDGGRAETERPQQLTPAATGKSDTVKVGDKYEKVTWALVDADQVAASVGKGETQARDRTRAASEAQVAKIAGALDFRLLSESPQMDFGAPTLAADGRVVGGNGRVLAVQRAYEDGTGDTYRAPLIAALPRFGIDPKAAEGMGRPMLVRILGEGVDVRAAAIASNEGAGMRMSLLEQAPVDAGRLPDLNGFYVPEDGNLNAPANRDFVMNWIGKFPGTEQAALVDAVGALSQEGMIRLRNAVLFKAYGDNPTLQRLVELADPGAKNVGNALTKAGPPVAAARDAIRRGDLHPVDPLPDVLAAVEKFSQLKSEGTRTADFLAQGELMGPSMTPEARAILAFLDANTRSARAMSDMVAGMYRELERAGNPKQADFLGAEVPTVPDLVAAGIRYAGEPGVLSGSLFDAADSFPGRAGAPRSPASAMHKAQSRADQAEADAPLFETAVNCEKAAA